MPPSSSFLSREQVIAIAEADGVQTYDDLSKFTREVALLGDRWHVDYWLRKRRVAGGGPHYIIHAWTGEILYKNYCQ